MEIAVEGHDVVVRKNEGHPENYVYISVDGRDFFLGVLQKGTTRRQVRELARRWLRDHPNALND